MTSISALPDVLNKMRWHVAKRLPGSDGWDKMKVVGKGMSPLTNNAKGPDTVAPKLNPYAEARAKRMQSNPFLSKVIAQSTPATKSGSVGKTAGVFSSIFKPIFNAAKSATKTAPKLSKSMPKPLQAFFQETGPGGKFESMTGAIMPGIGRGVGGYYVGSLFDSQDPENKGIGVGGITGAIAGLAGPTALRLGVGSKVAPQWSFRKMLTSPKVSRRLINDPLNRIMITGAAGDLLEAGAGALGFDQLEGQGRRIGVMGGLLGGARPWQQIARGASPGVDRFFRTVAVTKPGRFMSKGLTKAQTGGFSYLPAVALGSPYAAWQSGMGPLMGMTSHAVGETVVGDRVRDLADRKKVITSTMSDPALKPLIRSLDQMIKQNFGPNASFYGPDGLPSKEGLQSIQFLGQHGLLQLQHMGQNYFNDPGYLLNPNNWARVSRPVYAAIDAMRGQAGRINPINF